MHTTKLFKSCIVSHKVLVTSSIFPLPTTPAAVEAEKREYDDLVLVTQQPLPEAGTDPEVEHVNTCSLILFKYGLDLINFSILT